MHDVKASNSTWSGWGLRLLAVTAAAVGAWWLLPRWWPYPLAMLHDRLILPLALKGVYANASIAWFLGEACVLCLLLWPHRVRWRSFLLWIVVVILIVPWITMYEMWHNAFFSSALLIAVFAYVALRYLWVPAIRTPVVGPVLGERIHRSLLLYAKSPHERRQYYDGIRLYYDAMRAALYPSRVKSQLGARLWQRPYTGLDLASALSWSLLFALPASWYRRAGEARADRPLAPLSRVGMAFLRFVSWRKVPSSLQIEWLQRILDHVVEKAWKSLWESENDPEAWFAAYQTLIDATEARIEYGLFDPGATPRESSELAAAADHFDELGRIALARQLYTANVLRSGGEEHWKSLAERRRTLMQKAIWIREYALDLEGEAEDQESRMAAVWRRIETPDSAEMKAQAMVLGMAYCQLALYADGGHKVEQAIAALVDGLGPIAGASAANRRSVAWKLVELACDWGDFQLARDALALNWTCTRATESDEDPRDLLAAQRDRRLAAQLEGNLLWWPGRAAKHGTVQRDELERAGTAFLRGNCTERIHLRDEVRSMIAESV